MRAVQLSLEYEEAFLAMVDDYRLNDPANGESYLDGFLDFGGYASRLVLDELGINMPEGLVPCTHRWLLTDSGEIGAIVRIRHTIDHPFLNSVGGHIGYDVPPAQRGKRYSIAALLHGIDVARELGLTEVLVCADADNEASCRTIVRCGGVLEKEFLSEHWPTPVRRYWIQVAPQK